MTVLSMKENGKMINSMELGLNNGRMEQCIRVLMFLGKKKDKEYLNGRKDLITKVNLRIMQ